ncbi:hypothetical protein, partial [Collinsella aerofaciens]|uniref:hypothetical protein n=1 Tax=Collinsella aerofaciens TaxID=74426 RepID=UPI00321B8F88
LWHPEPAERSCAAGEATQMAFSYRLALKAAFTKQLNQSNHPPVNIDVHRSVAGSLFSMD